MVFLIFATKKPGFWIGYFPLKPEDSLFLPLCAFAS
jgi:hypothetical protein